MTGNAEKAYSLRVELLLRSEAVSFGFAARDAKRITSPAQLRERSPGAQVGWCPYSCGKGKGAFFLVDTSNRPRG
ncbi:MAG: hypothetical protein ACHQZS_12530, partial [Candidatus Binatales bacterium]